jgi:Asparagine synthase/Glutamine amidotransferase domain
VTPVQTEAHISESVRIQPGFWGVIGKYSRPDVSETMHREQGSRAIWSCDAQQFRLHLHGKCPGLAISWHDIQERPERPSALVFGSPFIASDSRYGEQTRVERLELAEAPDIVARLYGQHGTGAFALLDGDFSLVLSDPQSKNVFLVVDKFGCNDIFIRETDKYILFASDSASLLDGDMPWDPVVIAFFLAQEGFVPSPFTLSTEVKGIGRARFLRVHKDTNGLQIHCERYWHPDGNWDLPSRETATTKFFDLLKSATSVRTDRRSSILLSGGVDSSLLLNLASPLDGSKLVALTGAVKGFVDWEIGIAQAARLAAALKVPHASITIDPSDESLTEEWALCTGSWATGTRVTLPLFLRCGAYLRDRLGEGYSTLSGQMADTLADNNYTIASPGYTLRRSFCSPWFLSIMPWVRYLSPRKNRLVGRALVAIVQALRGERFAGMVDSVLDGMTGVQSFYAGRIFGYGEMPGRSAAYFPALRRAGFDEVVDWYSSNFVKPVASRLRASTFYRDMIELSMDMGMLHLDTRLVFQAFRLAGGKAQLPFLDSRVVNFFCSLPYSARAFYREPKHIIRDQFRRQKLLYKDKSEDVACARSGNAVPVDQLVLGGSLGAYFRDLLCACKLPDRVPGMFELIDERYFSDQIRSFRNGNNGCNYRFISRLAALELWSQTVPVQKSIFLA